MRLARCLLFTFFALLVQAAPEWRTPPKSLPFGELADLELVESDPTAPPLPRPGEEKLGPLALRSVTSTADGRGWRLTVQPLVLGNATLPALDLGDGRRSPELRLEVPRTTPFEAPWIGLGGGRSDVLPSVPFPWGWASLLLLPFGALAWLGLARWRRGRSGRLLRQARRAFAHHWPPPSKERKVLDAAHERGRDLLEARFGFEARAWGPPDFQARKLVPWSTWVKSLDAARFGRTKPAFPNLEELLRALGEPR